MRRGVWSRDWYDGLLDFCLVTIIERDLDYTVGYKSYFRLEVGSIEV